MIVRAAVCPSPPLLASGVTGQDVLLPELRDACAAAVAWLLAADPDIVAVIGPATATATWPPDSVPDLSMHAPAAYPGPATLPLALVIGAQLLDAAGYSGPRVLASVAGSASLGACLELGRELAAAAPRVALLVMGDGSARRSAAAPGYLDDRAEPFDAAVEQAFRDGDLSALTALDPDLARDLLAAGRPAWQALVGALSPAPGSAAPRASAMAPPSGSVDAPARGVPAGAAGAPVSIVPAGAAGAAASGVPAGAAGAAASGVPVGSADAPPSGVPVGSPSAVNSQAEVLYSAAPFGVAYLVATVAPAP
jgi:hypothetical protein